MERIASEYDHFYAEKDFQHFQQDRIFVSHLISFLPSINNSMVLDVGCGRGYWSKLFYECGVSKIVGIDLSSVAINSAQHSIPEGNFFVADAQKLPLKDTTFDLIFCQGLSLYSTDNLEAKRPLGKELLRCCKDGALFVFAWSTNLSGGKRKKGDWQEHKWQSVVTYFEGLNCEIVAWFVIDRKILLKILGRLVFNGFFSKLLIPIVCRLTSLPGHLVCIAKKKPVNNKIRAKNEN